MPVETVPTEQRAKRLFEVFNARSWRRTVPMQFSWPERMQEVGAAKAEMYRSNKWKRDLKVYEDYKHVAEDWQTLYIEPGFLRDWGRPVKKIEVHGPMVTFEGPMPQHFTILAPLIGLQVHLFDAQGKPPKGSGYYEVTVPHGMLGAAEHPKTKETLLFVYTRGGIHMLMTGPTLAIEKDGIVG